MKLRQLNESPQHKTLKDNQIKLTDEERNKVLAAKAIWHKGKDGAESPAVRKSVVRGKTYYWSATHRCMQVDASLDKAIQQYHDVVEPSG